MAAISVDSDPEFFHGLTMWGDFGAAQIRNEGLALHVGPNAQRSTREEGQPVIVALDEARKLRDLLNLATARGML